jgi:hypothetical protein
MKHNSQSSAIKAAALSMKLLTFAQKKRCPTLIPLATKLRNECASSWKYFQ